MIGHLASSRLTRAVARRLIVPAILLVVLAGTLIYLTFSIEADNREKLGEMGSMLWQIDKVDARIAGLAKALNIVRSQGQHLAEVQESGFVGDQNRLRAAQLLEELGPKYDLSSLHYDFMPQAVELVESDDTVFRLARTDVALTIGSLTDTQLLGFVAEFTERLDGQIQIWSFDVRRAQDVSVELLKQIAEGARPTLFEAEIRLTWNNVTVVVDSEVGADNDDVQDDGDSDGDIDSS